MSDILDILVNSPAGKPDYYDYFDNLIIYMINENRIMCTESETIELNHMFDFVRCDSINNLIKKFRKPYVYKCLMMPDREILINIKLIVDYREIRKIKSIIQIFNTYIFSIKLFNNKLKLLPVDDPRHNNIIYDINKNEEICNLIQNYLNIIVFKKNNIPDNFSNDIFELSIICTKNKTEVDMNMNDFEQRGKFYSLE